jgi:hypothetical protein
MSDDLLDQIRIQGVVPAHIAVIMDGNAPVREVVEGCLDAGSDA